MKKNLYFREQINRQKINHAALRQLINIASYPRLVLEVFLRKNFGQRYFSMGDAGVILLVLGAIPIIRPYMARSYVPFEWGDFLIHYSTWYAFLAAFYMFSSRREKEISREISVFDFGKYSLYSGDIDPRFYRINAGKTDVRKIETVYEPVIFLVAGIALSIVGQKIGAVLTTCSIFYLLGSAAAYKLGDDFVMNHIDEMICNEELEDTFVNDKQPEDARGVRFYGRKPVSEENRRKLVPTFTEDQTVPIS